MRRNIFICLALAGITLAVFWPVRRLNFFAYDDPVYIILNPMVQGGVNADSVWWAFTSYHAGNWHPVTWLSHALDCQIVRQEPRRLSPGQSGISHREHAAAVYRAAKDDANRVAQRAGGGLVRLASGARPVGGLDFGTQGHVKRFFHAADIVGVCAIRAKTVERRWSRVEGPAVPSLNPRLWAFDYWMVLVLFALGLMSKPMLVTLPAILLLLDFWPLNRMSAANPSAPAGRVIHFSTFKGLLWEKIPLLALSLASVLATFWAQGGSGFIIKSANLPLPVRVANVPVFCTVYLEKLFWPENLAVFYPYRHIPFWEQAGSLLLLALLTVICLRRIRSQPGWLAGWLWFLIMLLPVIGLVQVGGQSFADRYTYLPSIGIFVIAVWGLGEIAAISRRWLTGVTIGATALLLACLLDTRIQLSYWRDSITLFRHALARNQRKQFRMLFWPG